VDDFLSPLLLIYIIMYEVMICVPLYQLVLVSKYFIVYTVIKIRPCISLSENRVLWRIFGPKLDEITGRWRKMHNKELHNLYSSTNIIRIIQSRKMNWADHVARMRKKGNACRILVEKPGGKN
jgi:hypothetical protein